MTISDCSKDTTPGQKARYAALLIGVAALVYAGVDCVSHRDSKEYKARAAAQAAKAADDAERSRIIIYSDTNGTPKFAQFGMLSAEVVPDQKVHSDGTTRDLYFDFSGRLATRFSPLALDDAVKQINPFLKAGNQIQDGQPYNGFRYLPRSLKDLTNGLAEKRIR
jgi:hypothetical protein